MTSDTPWIAGVSRPGPSKLKPFVLSQPQNAATVVPWSGSRRLVMNDCSGSVSALPVAAGLPPPKRQAGVGDSHRRTVCGSPPQQPRPALQACRCQSGKPPLNARQRQNSTRAAQATWDAGTKQRTRSSRTWGRATNGRETQFCSLRRSLRALNYHPGTRPAALPACFVWLTQTVC